MLSSLTLSLLFSVVFVVTGGYSLVRLAELVATGDTGGGRVAESSHLLMSIAMIVMIWVPGGGPSSAGGVVMIIVFGAFMVVFGARLFAPAAGPSRAAPGHHVIMNAAMVWMVAAMPWIMGTDGAATGADSDGHDHSTMSAMPGMGGAGHGSLVAGTPGWVTAVSGVFVVVLAAAAVMWAVRVVRPDPVVTAPPPARATPGGVVVLGAPSRVRPIGPRLDAGCHALMGLGMAGMLLAMS